MPGGSDKLSHGNAKPQIGSTTASKELRDFVVAFAPLAEQNSHAAARRKEVSAVRDQAARVETPYRLFVTCKLE